MARKSRYIGYQNALKTMRNAPEVSKRGTAPPCLAEADFPTELYGLDFKLFVANFFLCHFDLHLHLISYLNP